jgi:two-component system response regulator HydG
MHDTFALDRLVGDSAWTMRTRRRILQAASYFYPALITGPAGTGKKLIARAIHAHSSQSSGPFIPFRCHRVPVSFRASQLFGHEAGSMPLSFGSAIGAVGAAQDGTLFLDEVGQLDADCQARLLSVLKANRCRPIGATTEKETRIRIIASSSVDLHDEVRRGRFRFDLLYRLNALSITALPLNARRDDIPALVRHVIARTTLERGLPLKPITAAAIALLQSVDWRNNVDQLQQVVEQATAASNDPVLNTEAFAGLLDAVEPIPEAGTEASRVDSEAVNALESVPEFPQIANPWPSLAEVEARHIRATLQQVHHHLEAAAQLLGIEPARLQQKLIQYGIPLYLPRHPRRAEV